MKNILLGFCLLIFSTLGFADDQLHLDKTVKLANGNMAYVYNNGASVVVKNSQGEIQQTSSFDSSSISLNNAIDFLQTLQSAVKNNDKKVLARLMHYPLHVSGTHLKITSANSFSKHYSEIITPKIRDAILQQEPYAMFANYQGVMLGSGQVWFNNISSDAKNQKNKILVITINI